MDTANILFHLVQTLDKRYFYTEPNQGDLVVFKTPADNRTDYIKRLIGLPGDHIQFKDGSIFINDKEIVREKLMKKISKMRKVFFRSQHIYRNSSKWNKIHRSV